MPDEPSYQPPSASAEATVLVSEERVRFRRGVKRVSITVVLIVVAAHLLVGLGAAVFVVARYFDKPKAQFTQVKQVEMKPEEAKHRLQMAEVESMKPKPSLNNRIQSLKPSALVLPSLPNVPVDTAIPIDTSAAPSSALAAGVSAVGTGTGSGSGFFGSAGSVGSGLLEGTLYDLKQMKDGSDSKMDLGKYDSEMRRVADRGPNGVLSKYFAAPVKLYLPHLAIPQIGAKDAPSAFKVADKVQPKMWLAVYNGTVIAPESGHFMFDGFADDVLLVWVNRRLVFDGGLFWYSPIGGDRGKRKTPAFTMQKGSSYNLQIAIGERPGGYFIAWLQAKNMQTGKAFWVRVTSEPVNWDSAKPFWKGSDVPPGADPNGPIWLPASVSKSASSISGVGL